MSLNKTQIEEIKNEASQKLSQVKDLTSLADFKKEYLGKKGKITLLFAELKKMPDKKRGEVGKALNQTKAVLINEFEAREKALSGKAQKGPGEARLDITRPGKKMEQGHLHPLTLVQQECENIFQSMGFAVVTGPEIENEWYNFDALNVPADHPARDMWNTLWLCQSEIKNEQVPRKREQKRTSSACERAKIKNSKLLLRTHTSPVQIRYMEKHQPPLRIIAPGRVFRYEATDVTHDIQFYQLEGLMVDKNISVANFKAIIKEFLKRFFKTDVEIRLRPSFFPFTEPSFEIDVRRKGQNWLELMGAGMVHANVFKAAGYVSKNWQGFAFGVGLDRLAMLKYKINDIRLFYGSDLRFLNQF